MVPTLRILVIDDNEDLRRLLLLVLSNYTVLEAANGREGLQVFRDHSPELVITDMIMPEMGGVETIKALQQQNPTPKVIAISGGGHAPAANYLWIAEQLGVNRTLEKPFRPQELLQVVGEVLVQA